MGVGVSWRSLRSSYKTCLVRLAVDVTLIALIVMLVLGYCTPQTKVVSGTPVIQLEPL